MGWGGGRMDLDYQLEEIHGGYAFEKLGKNQEF